MSPLHQLVKNFTTEAHQTRKSKINWNIQQSPSSFEKASFSVWITQEVERVLQLLHFSFQ